MNIHLFNKGTERRTKRQNIVLLLRDVTAEHFRKTLIYVFSSCLYSRNIYIPIELFVRSNVHFSQRQIQVFERLQTKKNVYHTSFYFIIIFMYSRVAVSRRSLDEPHDWLIKSHVTQRYFSQLYTRAVKVPRLFLNLRNTVWHASQCLKQTFQC